MYIYIYVYSFIFFSIMVYPRILNIVPCDTQWDHVFYPLYVKELACTHPEPPVHPSPTPAPLATTVCSPCL